MARNYQPFLKAALDRKERGQREAFDMLYDDPTVPRKMLRSISRARAGSFSALDSLRYNEFVSREDLTRELTLLEALHAQRKGRHDTADPDGFGTGVYVDVIQVLREALRNGDEAGK